MQKVRAGSTWAAVYESYFSLCVCVCIVYYGNGK